MNLLSFVDFLTLGQYGRQLRSDVRVFKPTLLHQVVFGGAHASRVTWLMSHGSRGSWVIAASGRIW